MENPQNKWSFLGKTLNISMDHLYIPWLCHNRHNQRLCHHIPVETQPKNPQKPSSGRRSLSSSQLSSTFFNFEGAAFWAFSDPRDLGADLGCFPQWEDTNGADVFKQKWENRSSMMLVGG